MKKYKKDNRKIILELIKKMDYPTKKEIWKAINKKMPLGEISKILNDLEKSNKTLIDDDDRIIWTYNPKLLQKIKEEGLKLY